MWPLYYLSDVTTLAQTSNNMAKRISLTDRPEAAFEVTVHYPLLHAATKAKVMPGAFNGRGATSAHDVYCAYAVLLEVFGSNKSYSLTEVANEYARLADVTTKTAFLTLQRGDGYFWDVLDNKSAGKHKIDSIPTGMHRRPSRVIAIYDLSKACRKFGLAATINEGDIAREDARYFLSGNKSSWSFYRSLVHLISGRDYHTYRSEMVELFGFDARTMRRMERSLALPKRPTWILVDLARAGAYTDMIARERESYLQSLDEDTRAYVLSQEPLFGRVDTSTEDGRTLCYNGNPKFRGAFARDGHIHLNGTKFHFDGMEPEWFAAHLKRGPNEYVSIPLRSRETMSDKQFSCSTANASSLSYIGKWRAQEVWSPLLSHVCPVIDPLRGLSQVIRTENEDYGISVRTSSHSRSLSYDRIYGISSVEDMMFSREYDVRTEDVAFEDYEDGSCNYSYQNAMDGEAMTTRKALTHHNIRKLTATQLESAKLVRIEYALLRTGLASLSALELNLIVTRDRNLDEHKAVARCRDLALCHKLLYHDRFLDALDEVIAEMVSYRALRENAPNASQAELIDDLEKMNFLGRRRMI